MAIDCDLEDSSRAFNEFDLDPIEGTLELGDQTGRLRMIVSLHTELDLDIHGCSFGWVWRLLRTTAGPLPTLQELAAPFWNALFSPSSTLFTSIELIWADTRDLYRSCSRP